MFRAYLPKALALSVLTAGLTFAGAQQAQTPDQAPPPSYNAPMHHRHAANPQKQAEHLSKKLNLTSDQTAKIEPILADRDQKMQALWQNQQLAPEDRHSQMKAINEAAEQQMAGVLSPEQMTQMKAMRHEHRGHHGPNGPQGDNNQSPS